MEKRKKMFCCHNSISKRGYSIFINQPNKHHTIDEWMALTNEERNFFALAEEAYDMNMRNEILDINAYTTFMTCMKNEKEFMTKYPDFNSRYIKKDHKDSLDTFSRIWANLNKRDRKAFYNEARDLKKLIESDLSE
jgi:hypothetical protein